MTQKEKARELVDKFENYSYSDIERKISAFQYAKQCALICVQELIEESHGMFEERRYNYWLEVKTEINNL